MKSLGREMVLVCVNHWPLAIETHRRNHPSARHYIEDISAAKPCDIVTEGYLDLLMASPECTHFSRARGGKPVSDQSRMNPWAIIRWLTDLDVQTLLVENVPEFVQWGPIDSDGKPIRDKRGIHFQAWRQTILDLGYEVEWKYLNAADYGDATTRRRFFLIARKDGQPVRWPEHTHTGTEDGSLNLPKWRAAREIIDWDNKGRSLLDDPKYKKKPLSINTRRRIARGLEKFGGVFAPLYINLLGLEAETGGSGVSQSFTIQNRKNGKARGMDEPVWTITASNGGGGQMMVEPTVEPFIMANRSNNIPRSVDEPIHTMTAGNMGGIYIVEPESFILGQQSGSAARDTGKPVMTVAGAGAISLVDPQLVVFHGKSDTQEIDRPCPSQPTKSKLGLVDPQIAKYYGNENDTESIEKPLGTVTTKDRFGLVEPKVEPFIVQNRLYYNRKGDPTRAPHDIEKPLPAVTGHGAGAIVEPILKNVSGTPADKNRIVILNGEPYLLDIRFRMLSNHELARAMGFDSNEAEYEFLGNVAEVTKQIGNAVPVNTACALVKAILGGK